MKKYKEHYFFNYDPYGIRVISTKDKCLFCQKTGEELFSDINESDKKILKNLSLRIIEPKFKYKEIFIFQIEWLKNNSKCISEEEYIIKQLLE